LISITVYRTSLGAADDAQVGMGCLFEFEPTMLLSEMVNNILSQEQFTVLRSKTSDWSEVWHFIKEGKVLATSISVDNSFDLKVLSEYSVGNIFSSGDELYIQRDVEAIKQRRVLFESNKAQDKIDKAIGRNRKRNK
jgi:hypothetical protein